MSDDELNVLEEIKDLLTGIKADTGEINHGIEMMLDNHMDYPTSG